MTETLLVRACLEYLQYKKVFAYRQNTGAVKTERGGFIRFGTKGAPDIIAVIGGAYVGIECKVGKNRQSPDQKTFQKELEKAGGLYWLVYSLDDLELKTQDYI